MPRPAVAVLALVALLLTGCTSGGVVGASSGDEAAGGGGVAPAAAPRAAAGQGAAQGGTGAVAGAAPAGQAAVPVTGRSLVRTGELEVVVDDVPRAADDAGRLARGLGGSVETDERSTDGSRSGGQPEGSGSAVLRLRVPPGSFDAALARLAGLGEERSRSLGSKDVTEQVVDLDSRLATQRASVDRVRALLGRADTLGEVVQVEAELTKRTADLESLQARVEALRAQVESATLTLRLVARQDAVATAAGPLGFGDGLRAGWGTLQAAARAVAVTVGALLPFTPLLLLVVAGMWWRTRGRRPVGGPAA